MRAQLLTLDHLVQLMDPKLYVHLQSADSTNFFFFFRMLLVWYKREFEWTDTLRLWETLWTDFLSSSFHLFIALALLEKHRDVIMDHLKQFDEVLKYGMSSAEVTAGSAALANGVLGETVNELSNTIDLQSTLIRAESLFRRFQRTVEAVDKKHNFPAPSIRPLKPIATDTAGSSSSVPVDSNSGASRSAPVPGNAGGRSGNSLGKAAAQGIGGDRLKVISPELRKLLSREVMILNKQKPVGHDGSS